jgi:hypothetical protein
MDVGRRFLVLYMSRDLEGFRGDGVVVSSLPPAREPPESEPFLSIG